MVKNKRLFVYGLIAFLFASINIINQDVFAKQSLAGGGTILYRQMPDEYKDGYQDHTRIAIENHSHHIYQFYYTSYQAPNGYGYLPVKGTILLPGQRFIAGFVNLRKSHVTESFRLRDLSSSLDVILSAKFDDHRTRPLDRFAMTLNFTKSGQASPAPMGNSRFINAPTIKYINGTKNGHAYPGSDGTYVDNGKSILSSNYLDILDANPPSDESPMVKAPELSAHRFYYCGQAGCHAAYRIKVVSGILNPNRGYQYRHAAQQQVNTNHYNIAMLPYRVVLWQNVNNYQDLLVPLAPGLLIQQDNDKVRLSTPSEFVVSPTVNSVKSHILLDSDLHVAQYLDVGSLDDEAVNYNITGPLVGAAILPLSSSITNPPLIEDVSDLHLLLTSNTNKLYDNGEQEAKLGVVLCHVVPKNGYCTDPVALDSPLYDDIYFSYSKANQPSMTVVTNAYKTGTTPNYVLIESEDANSASDKLSQHYTTEYPLKSVVRSDNGIPMARSYYFSVLPVSSASATSYTLHANLCEPEQSGKVKCADSRSKVVIQAVATDANTFKALPVSGTDRANGILFNQPVRCLKTVTGLTDKADYLPTYRDSKTHSVFGTIRGVINYFDPTSANGTLTCDSSNDKHLVRVNSKVNSIYLGDIRAVDKAGNYYHGVLYPK